MLFSNQKASKPELFIQPVTYKDQVDDYTIGKFETLGEAKEGAQKYFFENYKTIPVLNWKKEQITA